MLWHPWMLPKLEQGTRAAQLSCPRELQPQGLLGEMTTPCKHCSTYTMEKPLKGPFLPSPGFPEECRHPILDRAAEGQFSLVRLWLAGGRGPRW